MRIALTVDGTRGDVHPLLALGERLAARGHEIVVASPPDFAADARARGFRFHPVGRAARETLVEQAEAIVQGGLRMLRAANRYFRDSVQAQFAALPDVVSGADLVVGAGVQFAAASVAERHRIPYRYVVYCPVLFPSADHEPFMLPLPRLPRLVNRMLWWLAEGTYELILARPLNRERTRLGLRPIRGLFRHFVTPEPFLAFDPELAPVPSELRGGAARVIGCLHPLTGPELPPKLEAFLASGPPPVYLGFGSMTDSDPAATTRLLLEAIERSGCRALVSEGWAGLGWTPLPEGVLAIGAVSHARLFPRVAAVVHHGGAGTTTTAARAGVPQVVVPHVLDQIYWGRRVEALGLGPPAIPRTKLTPERLAAAIREALENEVVQERARELGAAILARVAADGDPARHFEIA
jgi:UDP:flavonoid glycosyltransferase YjiC (YdhE family)